MAQTLDGITFNTQLKIESWSDPVIDALGHDPRSTYVERFWLPVLGPSTTLLLRLLVNRLESSPSGCSINVGETSRELGLGDRAGRHAPFLRTIARSLDFDMARLTAPGTLAIRRHLPTLSGRHLARLPESLQREHRYVAHQVGAPAEMMRRRGQQLALSLLEIGEGTDETERQLLLWKFHPSLAHQCVLWALRELRTHSTSGDRDGASCTISPRSHPCFGASPDVKRTLSV